MTAKIVLAGFGGQGILFAGKQIAQVAMEKGLFVTWLPSYGPEMRGGTANCSVIVSDEPIGSPLVTKPEILIAMNLPSYDKFENAVVSGGLILQDSTLISKCTSRTNITEHRIPASAMAEENSLKGLANVIMLGKLLNVTGMFTHGEFADVMTSHIPQSKAHLIDANKKALALGFEYKS